MQIETERLILRVMKKESVDGLKKIRSGTRFLASDCGLYA